LGNSETAPMSQIIVRVPASSSNFGPGFDCLGAALQIYNEVTLIRGGADKVSPIVRETARVFFKTARVRPISFGCSISDKIPRRRGLGSSATVRSGLLLALNALAGGGLSRQEIFELCAGLEGHPDNAAPAIFGGFTVVRGRSVQRFDISSRLRFVILVPELEIKTPAARRILPSRIKFGDAVRNSGNASTIASAFASGDYEKARGAFEDYLHQPTRTRLIRFLPRVISAAEKQGALGAFLSGSGSAIAAVTLEHAEKIGRAMLKASGAKGKVVIVRADNRGAVVRGDRKGR
jgi:homoserine kinase